MKFVTFTLIITLFAIGSYGQQSIDLPVSDHQNYHKKEQLLKARKSLYTWMKQNLSLDASQQRELYDLVVENDEADLVYSKQTVGRNVSWDYALTEEEVAEVEAHNNKYKEAVAAILSSKQMEILLSKEDEIRELIIHTLQND